MMDVIIVGGGPAGVGAAEALTKLGMSVAIIDASPFGGGVPVELSCKGESECTRCHVCMPRDSAERMRAVGDIDTYSMAKIRSVNFLDSNIEIELEIAPRYVRANKCIDCGMCVAACPVEGAIIAPPHGALTRVPCIEKDACAHFTSKKCNLCSEACPTDAIKYRERPRKTKLVARAVILATGLEPVDPSGALHYGYGVHPNIVTSLDAERITARFGELRRPSDCKRPEKVALIQCAGSRTTKGGVEYCSKFCCKYGIRIARALFDRNPEMNISFIYMDLRTFEPRSEAIKWAERKKNVTISQGAPGYIQGAEGGNLAVRRTSPFDGAIEEDEFELIILNIGGRPRPETKVIAEHFSLSIDEHGFLSEGDPKRGVFVAGSCKAPMDIEESYADGRAAAISVISVLGVK